MAGNIDDLRGKGAGRQGREHGSPRGPGRFGAEHARTRGTGPPEFGVPGTGDTLADVSMPTPATRWATLLKLLARKMSENARDEAPFRGNSIPRTDRQEKKVAERNALDVVAWPCCCCPY